MSSDSKFPPQVYYILGNETAERFSYYGMRQLLQLYITMALLRTADEATLVTHLFAAANYMMPFLGGWVSDRLWGRYRTIFWVSLFYVAGHAVLALADFIPGLDRTAKFYFLCVGLALIAFGSGGIKPCVSAFLGDQFKPSSKRLLSVAYSAFYWCINLGSFFALCIMPTIRDKYGYGWAFGVPGIAMLLAAIIFWLGRHLYEHAPILRRPGDGKMAILFCVLILGLILGQIHWSHPWLHHLPVITGGTLVAAWLGFGIWGCFQRGKERPSDMQTLGRVMSIFMFVPMFWALFDQTFSTWITQGNKMVPYMLGSWKIGAEELNAANALMVMILIPILTPLCLWLGKLASPLRRMTVGMMLAGVSFLLIARIQARLDAGESLSILHQLAPYFVLTAAEVLVSTTGLEFAFTQAPASLKSVLSGLWQFNVAVGNTLVLLITTLGKTASGDSAATTDRFLFYALLTFGVSVCFAIVAKLYPEKSQQTPA